MDIPFDHLNINNNNSRRKGTYAISTSNVDSHLYSFYPNTIRLWNSLPEEVKLSKDIDTFKARIDGITLRTNY